MATTGIARGGMMTAFRLIDDDEARRLGIDVEECERDAAALLRGDDAGWVVEVPEPGI